MDETETRVVSFLSGKGGSGKSTVAIALAQLVTELGHRCLLIDFDLATNGATYFFLRHVKDERKGIWELLAEGDVSVNAEVIAIPDTGNMLHFIPSAVQSVRHPEAKWPARSELSKESLERVLRRVISDAQEKEATSPEFVFVDCQAGASLPAYVAAANSDQRVIVREADPISQSAASNLERRLGGRLMPQGSPGQLVNKLDVRGPIDYRSKSETYQSENRLPPLPFDSEVRRAFGARRLPVDWNNPSPFPFTLVETAKVLFPELSEDLDELQRKRVDQTREKYEARVRTLTAELRTLDQEQSEIERFRKRVQERFVRVGGVFGAAVGANIAAAPFVSLVWDVPAGTLAAVIAGAVICAAALLFWYYYRERTAVAARQADIRPKQRRADRITKQLERYQRTLWASLGDLIDIGFAGREGGSEEHLPQVADEETEGRDNTE